MTFLWKYTQQRFYRNVDVSHYSWVHHEIFSLDRLKENHNSMTTLSISETQLCFTLTLAHTKWFVPWRRQAFRLEANFVLCMSRWNACQIDSSVILFKWNLWQKSQVVNHLFFVAVCQICFFTKSMKKSSSIRAWCIWNLVSILGHDLLNEYWKFG